MSSNLTNYINSVNTLADTLKIVTEAFINEEMTTTKCSKEQALVVVSDTVYKHLSSTFKEECRQAVEQIPDNTHWQASDGTVYLKTKETMAHLNLADYANRIERTMRIDEERKGFNILSDKKAEELGYIPPKKMAK
jgi:hypothetical protein